jgi:predicted nucleotidyltransferase component of viral defense system
LAEEDRLKAWETLFRYALRAIDSVPGDVFNPANWSFGGGTVLMRRFHHRVSKDIDIFVPDPQYLGHLNPELNDDVAALTPKYLAQANYLKLYFPEGEVDFIAAAPVTDNPRVMERVLDRDVQVETSIEIVAKKVRYRGADFTARDVLDFAMVAEREPGEVGRITPLLLERKTEILQRLDSADKILRTTFAELDVLEYRRSYDDCVAVVRQALQR